MPDRPAAELLAAYDADYGDILGSNGTPYRNLLVRLARAEQALAEITDKGNDAANQLSRVAEMWASLTMDTPEDQAVHDRMVALTFQRVTAVRAALRASQGGQT